MQGHGLPACGKILRNRGFVSGHDSTGAGAPHLPGFGRCGRARLSTGFCIRGTASQPAERHPRDSGFVSGHDRRGCPTTWPEAKPNGSARFWQMWEGPALNRFLYQGHGFTACGKIPRDRGFVSGHDSTGAPQPGLRRSRTALPGFGRCGRARLSTGFCIRGTASQLAERYPETGALYQGTTSVVPSRQQNEPGFSRCGMFLLSCGAQILCRGTASQLAERYPETGALYQGTTSVVPYRQQNAPGFSRCGFAWFASDFPQPVQPGRRPSIASSGRFPPSPC